MSGSAGPASPSCSPCGPRAEPRTRAPSAPSTTPCARRVIGASPTSTCWPRRRPAPRASASPSAAATSPVSTMRSPTHTWPGSPTSSAGWRRAVSCPTDRCSSSRWHDHDRPRQPRDPVVRGAVRAGVAARAGEPRRTRTLAAASGERGHLHHRPEHQLHERLRRGLQILRLLPAAEARRRLRALVRADRSQDRRAEGAGRRADPHPGRPQPLHPVRVVPGSDALHQTAPSDPHPRVLALRSRFLRRPIRDVDRGGDPRAHDGRPRLDPGWGRGDSRPRGSRPRRQKESGRRPLARGHGDGPSAGTQDLGDDDVRPGRNAGRPGRAPVPRAGGPRTLRGLHRLHLLAAAARAHRPRPLREDRRGDLPPHAGNRAHRARQRTQHPSLLGDDGAQDRPGGAQVRSQRLRLAHDGGERRLRRGDDVADDPPRDAAAHRRRRLRAAAATPGLQRDRRGGLRVADVLIIVGSESDKPRIEPAFDVLSKAGVSYEFHVSSAHRQPDQTADLVKGARKKGFRVVIAGAGLSAALPGFAASLTDLPVIGVPFAAGPLNGLDALLAAAGLGDIAQMFPPTDPRWRDADSLGLLKRAYLRVVEAGLSFVSADITVILEQPKLARYLDDMRENLAGALVSGYSMVSVKAKTNEGMGWIGKGEGVAVLAVALLEQARP